MHHGFLLKCKCLFFFQMHSLFPNSISWSDETKTRVLSKDRKRRHRVGARQKKKRQSQAALFPPSSRPNRAPTCFFPRVERKSRLRQSAPLVRFFVWGRAFSATFMRVAFEKKNENSVLDATDAGAMDRILKNGMLKNEILFQMFRVLFYHTFCPIVPFPFLPSFFSFFFFRPT